MYERSLREQSAGPAGPKQQVFSDNEEKLQSFSVETVEKVVKVAGQSEPELEPGKEVIKGVQ